MASASKVKKKARSGKKLIVFQCGDTFIRMLDFLRQTDQLRVQSRSEFLRYCVDGYAYEIIKRATESYFPNADRSSKVCLAKELEWIMRNAIIERTDLPNKVKFTVTFVNKPKRTYEFEYEKGLPYVYLLLRDIHKRLEEEKLV